MKLFRFVVKRVWVSLIMLFLLVTISFFMVKLIPGSPYSYRGDPEFAGALVEAFKAGTKDSETYWIQRGPAFVLIRYYAVRSPEGEYLGVLECTEEISGLRALEGQKTLMS